MGVIITKSSGSGSGDSGVFSQAEKLALELEMEFKAANLYYYKELNYTDNKLTGVDIYTDNTKIVALFSKSLTYSDNKLMQINLTRISDGATLTKVFNYSGSSLINVEVSV
jgi:hypothetical protein